MEVIRRMLGSRLYDQSRRYSRRRRGADAEGLIGWVLHVGRSVVGGHTPPLGGADENVGGQYSKVIGPAL